MKTATIDGTVAVLVRFSHAQATVASIQSTSAAAAAARTARTRPNRPRTDRTAASAAPTAEIDQWRLSHRTRWPLAFRTESRTNGTLRTAVTATIRTGRLARVGRAIAGEGVATSGRTEAGMLRP